MTAPRLRSGPVPSTLHPPTPSRPPHRRSQAHLETLFEAYPRLKTAWDALQELYEADDLDGANQALSRFADLYDTGEIPEYHDVVDTIIAWGEEILAYHTSQRVTNGPIEGINNLLQVPRRVAHGFTNYSNYAARGVLVT